MAAGLKRTSFDVALHLDAGRAEMMQAIERHSALLAKQEAIGLFYFAGHGAQLAWRNYLVPADAMVDARRVGFDVQRVGDARFWSSFPRSCFRRGAFCDP